MYQKVLVKCAVIVTTVAIITYIELKVTTIMLLVHYMVTVTTVIIITYMQLRLPCWNVISAMCSYSNHCCSYKLRIVKILFKKCKQSNRMRIEDSNKDNYKQTFWAIWSQMYLQMYLQGFVHSLDQENPQVHCACFVPYIGKFSLLKYFRGCQ